MRYALWVTRYAWCVERWLQPAGPPDSSGFFESTNIRPECWAIYSQTRRLWLRYLKNRLKTVVLLLRQAQDRLVNSAFRNPIPVIPAPAEKKNQEELRFFLTPFFMINKVRLSRVLPPEEVVEYLLVGKKTSFYPCVVNLNVRRRLTVKGELPCNLFLKQEILLLNLLSAAMRPKSVYIFQISNSTDTKRKIHISCISHFA